MKLLFVSIISIFFPSLSSAPILRAGFESSSSQQRRNSHENENQALGWESRRSLLCLAFLFHFISLFFAAAAQHIAIDKTGQSHDFTFHRIKQTYSRKKERSRMIDENWLCAFHRRASSASCVAFMPALDLLIFRVVSSRNWRMGKYVRVFTSNWSPHRRGESDAWRRQSTLSFHFSSSATANG